MIDTYRRKIVPTRNFVDVALYILFFPQLVAGPIVRATDLLPQMREARSFAAVNFKYLLVLFLVGYFKKAVISDNISPLVDVFFAVPGKFGAGDAALAVVLYATQIYCNGLGYTDMAIATAGLLGYQLKPHSITLIFRRTWSISGDAGTLACRLGLRDYLYISLGGNRNGELNRARNVMITMLLGGLWHGASWNFVIWGALHGVGLLVCHAWQRMRENVRPGYKPRYSLIGNALTFIFVCFAWIFFRSPDFASAVTVIMRFRVLALPTLLTWQHAVAFGAALLAVHLLFYWIKLPAALGRVNDLIYATAFGAAIALVLPFVNIAVRPFIYFQFERERQATMAAWRSRKGRSIGLPLLVRRGQLSRLRNTAERFPVKPVSPKQRCREEPRRRRRTGLEPPG